MSQNTSKQVSISSIQISGEHNLSPPLKYYIAATPRVPIELEDTTRSVGLIDTGAEINIIILNLTRRAGFPIQDEPRFINIISQISYSRRFYGVVEEVSVKIGSAINTIFIWVVKKVNNEFVFRIPYIHASRIT